MGQVRPIEAAVALLYPRELRNAYELEPALAAARLRYRVLYRAGEAFPETGWIRGSAEDLADLVRLVSVSQEAVNQAAAAMERGIERAAAVLNAMAEARPAITRGIAALLGMTDVRQTRRMAAAILANAFAYHQRIAGMHPGVLPVDRVVGPAVTNPKPGTREAWDAILRINYWPIFGIARDILERLPAGEAAAVLHRLAETAGEIDAIGARNAHDLTGRIFQRLIADRKFLATFYTLPPSAALLARLAVEKLEGVDWGDPNAIRRLRVGDFACGTGALLSAAYDDIAARHERAGGDAAAIHAPMLEEVLHGCDVMPSAVHITGATLSGVHPGMGFELSRLYTMPYGRQRDGSVRIGSLELLRSSEVRTLFNTSDPALRTGSAGEETATQVNAVIPDGAFDLVIMNPPFTRNVSREGAAAEKSAAAFAAFSASDDDQRAMARRLGVLKSGRAYHGNAGLASAFAVLADRKLKPGGVMALVLPLSAASGLAWSGFRTMLAEEYSEVSVVSIAANGKDISFSSDTGMGECLVIARKGSPESEPGRVRFVCLDRRPASFVEAAVLARAVGERPEVRRIEDGPFGGTPIEIGATVGRILDAPQPGGASWGPVRLLDPALAQTAHSLSRSRLWLPGETDTPELPIAPLGEVGSLGIYHLDLIGPPPRGPFDKIAPSTTATYPSLWSHIAKLETRIICQPDSQLQVRPGMEQKAARAWETASRSHLSLDFRFTSQPLAVAFTERRSLGGRAWPNAGFDDPRFDYAFATWANCTLGFVMYWWNASRQQDGRGITTIRSAPSLPVLDFRRLGDDQFRTAETIFEEFRTLDFQPAFRADLDPTRALLDRRVVRDLLGLDEAAFRAVRRLAAKWCAEPSVHGGKRRPAGTSAYRLGTEADRLAEAAEPLAPYRTAAPPGPAGGVSRRGAGAAVRRRSGRAAPRG